MSNDIDKAMALLVGLGYHVRKAPLQKDPDKLYLIREKTTSKTTGRIWDKYRVVAKLYTKNTKIKKDHFCAIINLKEVKWAEFKNGKEVK